MAEVPALTGRSSIQRLGDIGRPGIDYFNSGKPAFNFLFDVFLCTVHLKSRLKNTIRKDGNPFPAAVYTDKLFCIIIPGGNILVADGPIHAMTVFQVGAKIHIAPSY